MSDPRPANQAQSELWNTASGETWVEMQAVLDRMLAPFAARLTDNGFPGRGLRVLDVGCGAGATTLEMARRLGPDGLCLGADISGPLVTAAQSRASPAGLENARFVQADAQTFDFPTASFDAVISRFGVMFFDDPEAAFANLRRAAGAGAPLTFVAWRSPAETPFFTTATQALAGLVPPPAPSEPGAPGQFAFADGARVERILSAAGWSDIRIERLDEPCVVAEADLAAYVTRLGPAGLALREADEATRTRAVDILRRAYEPFVHEGEARFTAACWLVRAQA